MPARAAIGLGQRVVFPQSGAKVATLAAEQQGQIVLKCILGGQIERHIQKGPLTPISGAVKSRTRLRGQKSVSGASGHLRLERPEEPALLSWEP